MRQQCREARRRRGVLSAFRPAIMRAMIPALLAAPGAAPAAAQVARFDWFEYRGSDPIDRAISPGPGMYRNPILQGFYPDPSVMRVARDYYLVTSTFGYFPGIPIFHSRDLVTWRQIGNAIDRPTQLNLSGTGLSQGVFAPTIQHRRGMNYILNTCVGCGGNFVLTAHNPAGPWSDPIWLPDLEGGIDPSLFFDEDGRSWIVNNGPPQGKPLYEGHRAIWIQQFDSRTLKTFGPRTVLVNGGVDIAKKPIWIEGPHLFRKDGWYYLSCAEGGTGEGHSQVILRSRSVTGPFLPGPGNPILTQRDLPPDRAHPITSTGHAQFVTTPDGQWWATFLGVRPYKSDFYSTGRETFLLPVRWEKGWPGITRPGQAIPFLHARPRLPAQARAPIPTSGAFTLRDEFNGTALAPYWTMLRTPQTRWFALEKGALALTARPVGLGDKSNPSFLGRRQQHANATVMTRLRFAPDREGERAGLVALQNDDFWFFVGTRKVGGKAAIVVERRDGAAEAPEGHIIHAVPARSEAPVYLRISINGDRYRFDYGYSQGRRAAAWHRLAEVRTDSLTTHKAGGFVGSMFGLFAARAE